MARRNFLKFVLNEDITVDGKPLKGDDDKEETPDYTGDKPEDDTGNTPPSDGTEPASPDDPPTDDGESPDYTKDAPEASDDGDGATDPGTTDSDGAGDPPATDDTSNGPDPETTDDTDTPDDGSGEEEQPDYTDDSPDNGDEPVANDSGDTTDDDNPDYTKDAPEDSGDDGSGDDVGDGSANDGAESPIDSDIDQMQTDIFANLSQAQITMKQKELKTQYVNLFSDIGGILERLSSVTRKQDNINKLEFITRKFLELKDMVRDSLVYGFDEKSYVQNQISLQNFIAIYANLIKIIEELGTPEDKK